MLRSSTLVLARLARRSVTVGVAPSLPKRTPQLARGLATGRHEVVSSFPDLAPPDQDLRDIMLDTARRFPHHTAIECGVTGRGYTYGQYVDAAFRYMGVLEGLGVGAGAVVAVLMPNCPEHAVVFLGGLLKNTTITHINPAFTPGEVSRQLGDSGAGVVVVDPLLEPLLDAALATLSTPPPLVLVNGPSAKGNRPNILDICSDAARPFGAVLEVTPQDLCVMPYSSGTTGPPKGTLIDHQAINANLPLVLHDEVNPLHPTTGEAQEAVLGLMPFFHAWGMYSVLGCSLVTGTKVVTMPKFLPDLFLHLIVKHKVGVLHLVPPLLQFLVTHPMVQPAHLASVRVAQCAAAPTPVQAADALKQKNSNIFFQEVYGMTETFPVTYTPLRRPEKIGSCGVLLSRCRARVEDLDTREPLPPGKEGELVLYSPSLMKGYHNNEDATRDIMTQDGFLRSGDVATYDEDGYFYIVDRIKELIKVKGAQVSPSELEEVLLDHPGVRDVGVVGVPDERAGEVPRAYVVAGPGGATEEALVQFVEGRVAPHKRLGGGVRFVEELPRNLSGKLLRRELRKRAEQDG